MKKLVCLVALLGACSAQTIPDATSNESALVAPRPVGCDVVRCPKGTVCEESCEGPRCVPTYPKPECVKDSDCRLFSDYCEGCNCVALGIGEPNPECSGTIVQCLIDPCLNVKAHCEYGSCVAGAATL